MAGKRTDVLRELQSLRKAVEAHPPMKRREELDLFRQIEEGMFEIMEIALKIPGDVCEIISWTKKNESGDARIRDMVNPATLKDPSLKAQLLADIEAIQETWGKIRSIHARLNGDELSKESKEKLTRQAYRLRNNLNASIRNMRLNYPYVKSIAEKALQLAQPADNSTAETTGLDEIDPAEAAQRIEQALHVVESARRTLAHAGMRLVVPVAEKYSPAIPDMLDLIQEGSIGLTTALNRYDYRCTISFSDYTRSWITEAVEAAASKQAHGVRQSALMAETINTIARAVKNMAEENGLQPSPGEIALETGLPEDQVRNVLRMSRELATREMLCEAERSSSKKFFSHS